MLIQKAKLKVPNLKCQRQAGQSLSNKAVASNALSLSYHALCGLTILHQFNISFEKMKYETSQIRHQVRQTHLQTE
jgi:hypothetical protein